MDPKQILAQRILLPELALKKFYFSKDHYQIHVVTQAWGSRPDGGVCTGCATLSLNVYDHRVIRVKDEPLRGKPVWLRIKKRRFHCQNCKKIFSEPIQGIMPRRRTTQRYRRAVLEACEQHQSIRAVRKLFKCSSSLIYTTLYEQLELRRRMRQHSWPEVIGIDEISFRRNKQFRCMEYASVIVDVNARRVMELVQGKKASDLVNALAEIPGRENVKWVVMDMCDPFRKFVRLFFPNAKIVADKFHVLRLITPSLLTTLKNETEVGVERRKIRSLMLSRPQNLSFAERSRLHRFLNPYARLLGMYNAKEKLFRLYEMRNATFAPESYEKFLGDLQVSNVYELQRLRNTLHKWRHEVLNYFQCRITNGITEGFNNKIKLVKRMAYGYRSFRNFRLRVLNACAG